MATRGLARFETALGVCAVAWGANGLLGLELPSDEPASWLRRRHPDFAEAEPPPEVEAAIAAIAVYLAGGPADLDAVRLDFESVGAWDAAVLREARKIPPGETLTYGALAARLGDAGQARAVGQALGRNPWPIVVPCHRITAADGRTGGFSAPGGVATKLRLLELEGALAPESLPLFAPR